MKRLRMFCTVILVFMLFIIISACNNSTTGNSNNKDEKSTIKVYAFNPDKEEAMDEMFDAVQEEMPEYDIEPLTVDFDNIEEVIRTGIAGGEPADVYFYQSQNMSNFVDDDLALNLTPYLEENNEEWKNTLDKNLLSLGEVDGKNYNVPWSSTFPVLYLNNEIFEEAGVDIEDEWSWSEFMEASKKISDNTDAYPFGIASRQTIQSWLIRQGVMSLAKEQGDLEALGNGEVKGTENYFGKALDNIEDLYESNYWYPGEGALSSDRDEVFGAFTRGEVAMFPEVGAQAVNMQDSVDFETTVVRWPSMGEENVALGGADGFFVPSNAPDPEASVEFLKVFLSEKIQSIFAEHGYPTANIEVESDYEIVNQVNAFTEDLYPYEFHLKTGRLTDYYQSEFVPNYLSGENNKEDVLNQLETYREEAYD